MTNKRFLNELSMQELSKLYDSNNYIQNAIYEIRNDDESYYIENEIYSYFKTYNNLLNRSTYSAFFECDAYNKVYIKINNTCDFINDCYEFCLHGIGLDDETKTIVNRLKSRVNLYDDVMQGYDDMSDYNFDMFSKWFENGLDKIKRALSDMIENIYDNISDSEYNKEFFIEGVLEFGYFEDMQTDGKNIYFEVCRG